MCEFFSCLALKTGILWDKNIDSHEDLVQKFKLRDSSIFPSFVRIEVVPKSFSEKDIKNIKSWNFKVDQDLIPDWFSKKEIEKTIKSKILPEVIKQLFVFDGIHEIKSGRIFACDSSQVEAYNSSQVKAYGSSQVKAYGSSQVKAYGSSQVKAYGSSQVKAYDSSQVKACYLSNIIAFNNSIIILKDNSKIIDRRK